MLQVGSSEAEGQHSSAVLALVSIARHYGIALDPIQVLRSDPFAGAEPTPALLMRMAERYGLSARRLHLGRGELKKLAKVVPAILLLSNGKAVVLEGVQDSDGVPIAMVRDAGSSDDASAIIDEHRLTEAWAGDVVVIKRRWRVRDDDRPFGLLWLVGQVLKEGHLLRDVAVAGTLLSILSLAPPMMFMILIDRVLWNRSLPTLAVLSCVLALVIVFDTAFGFVRRYLAEIAATRIDAGMNIYIFEKLLNLPMSFFEQWPTGKISGKLAAIWHIRNFLTFELFGTLLDVVLLFVLLPVLFFLNALLATFVCALAVCIIAIYVVYLPELRRRHYAMIEAEHAMSAHQVETIFGMRTVKSLSLEGLKRYQRDRFAAEVVERRHSFMFLINLPQTLVTPFERLIYSGSFFLGCYMILTDTDPQSLLQAGHVVAFAMIAARTVGPFMSLAMAVNSYEHARGAVGEVSSVVNVAPEEGRSGKGLKLPINGNIAFKQVRFRYNAGAQYALDGVSFEIPQGTIFGVMGRSGSGKTTVTRLLQGLNRDYDGLIKIDGMDLREIDLDHLRTNIGVVPQETFLFSGTIRENIGAPRPNISFEKIVNAAQMAGAEEFIEKLPRGYETHVEEGAVNFSGGQRQRLAIARALIVDPPILILDEATSALDAESEAIVNANLMRIAKDRTVIIISHRLSSLMKADAILVLEAGRFYDLGQHQDLVSRCDIYRTLWHQQNRHLEIEGHNAQLAIHSVNAA